MSDKYPHLKDTQYPNLANSNVWQYEQEFDFSKFDDIQMHIKLCNVPWDIGEVHVGLKSIPMGNVVGWNSKEERDTYLDGLEGMEWDTAYRAYHDGDTIKLPVPFEYMAYYNYVVVDYSKPPVANTDGTGITRFLYFIRDLHQKSINTTEGTIWRDSWSMFINDIDFSHMVLERGHYAMAKAYDVQTYLDSPIYHTHYLLTPDVSFGTPSTVQEAGKYIINDEGSIYAIASTAFVRSDSWGEFQTDGWKIPATPFTETEQTSPSYSIIGIEPENIGDFWEAVRTKCPQYMEAVKCIYLLPKKMVKLNLEFNWLGIKCYKLLELNPQAQVCDITKEMFGYGKYSDITKLYTAPYCHLEFTDGEGQTMTVNVEDMSSSIIEIANYVSIAYPYASVKSYLKGVGDSNEINVKYTNLSERNFKYSGKWWKYVWNHNIPTFAIFVGGKTRSTYNGWYTREGVTKQTEIGAQANYNISDINANVSKQMAKNNAQGAIDTTNVQSGEKGSNYANTEAANLQVDANTQADIDLSEKIVEHNNASTTDLANSSAQAELQTASITAGAATQTAGNEASAMVTTSVISGVAGTLSGGVNGFGSNGALGAATGAISGAINGAAGIASASVNANTTTTNAAINAGATMSASNVAANLTKVQANTTTSNDLLNQLSTRTNMEAKREIVKAYNTTTNENNCKAAKSMTSINASVTSNNADRQFIAIMGGSVESLGKNYAVTYTVDKGAAELSQTAANKATAAGTYAAEHEQWLQAPLQQGEFTNGEYDVVKPYGVWCNIVTQPFDCIAQAGQQMLRYGYTYDGTVDFKTFNVMPKFSYWKVSDIWCSAKTIPDAWVDDIRSLLLHGVTVWAKPEYINNTSVYDN